MPVTGAAPMLSSTEKPTLMILHLTERATIKDAKGMIIGQVGMVEVPPRQVNGSASRLPD